MTRRKVVLAGGSGFLGQSLARDLIAGGFEVDVLTRSVKPSAVGAQVLWDGQSVGEWMKSLEGATAVVNLTGKSVDCRYNAANRREIVESRVRSVETVSAALARCMAPPPVWVQFGSLAIYGNPGGAVCDEKCPHGTGFSVEVCQQWEAAFDASRVPAIRKVFLRIGFALGREGGALGPLARLARLGLGGTIGSGEQYISWIHIKDLNRMIQAAIGNDGVTGLYNATGPSPVRNADFMAALRKAVHRPWSPPVPAPLVHLGAWLMRTEPELALTGRRCIPRRFIEQGFHFDFPALQPALADVMS